MLPRLAFAKVGNLAETYLLIDRFRACKVTIFAPSRIPPDPANLTVVIFIYDPPGERLRLWRSGNELDVRSELNRWTLRGRIGRIGRIFHGLKRHFDWLFICGF